MEAAFQAPVLEAYSMTEAAHQMASNPLPPANRVAGSVGMGVGVEIGIMDEHGNLVENGQLGEVVVKEIMFFWDMKDNPDANAKALKMAGFVQEIKEERLKWISHHYGTL